MTVSGVRIESCSRDMTPEVSRILARAFVGNPLHVATFGPDRLARNESFFRGVLGTMTGTKLVALDGPQILGFIHWVRSPGCQPSGVEKARTAPAILVGVGLPATLRLLSWLSAWSRCEPAEAHVHLGPIGVDPIAQGKHIGGRLMERYVEELVRSGETGYLETDRPDNVRFYQHFGFETTRELNVSGVLNYLMWRPSGSAAP